MKWLEKDRSRRYGSPSEISADIKRYPNNEPVLATAPLCCVPAAEVCAAESRLSGAICGIAIVPVTGLIVSTYQALRARTAEKAAIAERDRADSEAAGARALNDFLQNDLLSQAGVDQTQNPDAAPDPDVKVKTLIDRAEAAIPKKFSGKPTVKADLRKTLGETYMSLGLLKPAQEQISQGYELNLRTRGPYARQTIEALQSLAMWSSMLQTSVNRRSISYWSGTLPALHWAPEDPLILIACSLWQGIIWSRATLKKHE